MKAKKASSTQTPGARPEGWNAPKFLTEASGSPRPAWMSDPTQLPKAPPSRPKLRAR